MMRIRKENLIFSPLNSVLVELPSPTSLTYLWNFGSLLGLCLFIQLITGIGLAMHYCADVSLAFASTHHILRNVNYGFLLKYTHANGASIFFVCVYIHIARGLYYGSYLKKQVWFSGILMYILMMLTAFIGYVLPWGQMSFWGATVITNFVSAIPYVGNQLVHWIWGGFSVGNATLSRFFSLHYLFPFILIALSIAHIVLLHAKGSSTPVGVSSKADKIPFHIYFTIKDGYGFILLTFVLASLLFYMPNVLSDTENFIHANPLVTPLHIMPEWYFLFAYAILRAIPNKLGGVVALLSSILIWVSLPYLHTNYMPHLSFRPIGRVCYWIFISNFMLLTWIGAKPVETPFISLAQWATFIYFTYFLVIIPLVGELENRILNPQVTHACSMKR